MNQIRSRSTTKQVERDVGQWIVRKQLSDRDIQDQKGMKEKKKHST